MGRDGRWTADDIGDQRGRVALVTGANTGLGFETARVLAAHGATVVLAGRDSAKLTDAATRIRTTATGADAEILEMDLASLASTRRAAERFRSQHEHLDLLINNAGAMLPRYSRTQDGFETHFGVNHLGHFALTGLLLDRLTITPGSRIVTVSSNAHRGGTINFDDPHTQDGYDATQAYAQSKLANLMFTFELQRRLSDAGTDTIAVAAHPGNAYTDLARHAPAWIRAALGPHFRLIYAWFIQTAPMGALPTLRAATDPEVSGGQYYGPDGWQEFRGYPATVDSSEYSRDVAAQRQLWELSEQATEIDLWPRATMN